jgi:flagellar secretion chaperone FliS
MTDAKLNSQAYRDYIESRVLSAHPVEIVEMLYQVAIDNLNVAIASLKTGDHFERSRAVTKAQGAIHELLAALDPGASESMCRNLAELYDYVLREMSTGHVRRSEEALRNALGVLKTLSEGWSGVKTSVIGGNQTAEAESPVPQKQAEATGISRWYTESSPVPASAQDWSC